LAYAQGLVLRWSAQARASEASALEPLAPRAIGAAPLTPAAAPGAQASAPPGAARASAGPLTGQQTDRLIQEAVASVQAAQST